MNVSSFRYSGLVHTKAIGVTPSVDKKGVIFVYKKAKKAVSISICVNPVSAFFMMNHNSENKRMTTCPLPQTEQNLEIILKPSSDIQTNAIKFSRTNQLRAPAASPSSRARSER